MKTFLGFSFDFWDLRMLIIKLKHVLLHIPIYCNTKRCTLLHCPRLGYKCTFRIWEGGNRVPCPEDTVPPSSKIFSGITDRNCHSPNLIFPSQHFVTTPPPSIVGKGGLAVSLAFIMLESLSFSLSLYLWQPWHLQFQ